jgi:DNA polymerase-3 subunit delta'
MLLSTILSRTQQIFVPKLSEKEVADTLLKSTRSEISEQQACNTARIANGNLLLAQSLIENADENYANFDRLVSLLRHAWQVGHRKDYNSLKKLRDWSESMASSETNREQQKRFLIYTQRIVRESFINNFKQQELNYLTDYESDFLKNFSVFINERNVEDFTAELALAERHTEQNVNAKMIFFDLALKTIVLLKR